MQKYLSLFLFFLFSPISFADTWEIMTKEEANAVVASLQDNPYIFEYCECCVSSTENAKAVQFSRVDSTVVIGSNWSSNGYSVRIYSTVLAEVFYTNGKPEVSRIAIPKELNSIKSVSMNYTWTFYESTKMATPFFNIVDYGSGVQDEKTCSEGFAFPTPSLLKTVSKHRAYKKWYKHHIENV